MKKSFIQFEQLKENDRIDKIRHSSENGSFLF
uniref:Uncharacterized protein n=1 Tax=Arundo donax TaxID=35708 RepID=A0A0A9GK60_ARUDO